VTPRVRVKICGLTRAADVHACAEAGADAIGLNCFAGSPRYVPPVRLRELAAATPPFVTPVLLFVNARREQVLSALAQVPHALLQFHGDEDEAFCASFARPYVRAVSMAHEGALLDCEQTFPSAVAMLADTPAVGYGGSGSVFDWAQVPVVSSRSKPLVLAGGLTAENVAAAIATTRPYAVDVSSGVECGVKGVKDPQRVCRFIAAVRAATTESQQA
jgi:phosphoribosylanthranilate isomerase